MIDVTGCHAIDGRKSAQGLTAPIAIDALVRMSSCVRRVALGIVLLGFFLALSALLPTTGAQAACSVPNTISNGQTADATAVMDNFNALKTCVDATENSAVSTSGAPVAGSLSIFSGPKVVTGGDLSGDCTTAGTLTVTCTKSNGTALGPFATGTDAGQLTGTMSVNRFGNGANADSLHFLRGDGVWATPPTGGGGGTTAPSYAGYLSPIPPDPATFTLSGANPPGTTTAYLAGNYFNITIPVSATAGSAKYGRALPTAPYSLYCAVSISGDSTTANDLSIGWLDSSFNFVRKLRLTMVNPNYRWGVSGTSDIKLLSNAQSFGTNAAFFMRIRNDGTNIKYYYSMDNGVTWLQFYSEATSSISTATMWGFQIQNSSTTSTLGATFWALYTG